MPPTAPAATAPPQDEFITHVDRLRNAQWRTKVKVQYTDIAVRSLTCHTATGTHTPRGFTQCYLPPGRGDIPAFIPAEASTRLSDPRRDARLS